MIKPKNDIILLLSLYNRSKPKSERVSPKKRGDKATKSADYLKEKEIRPELLETGLISINKPCKLSGYPIS